MQEEHQRIIDHLNRQFAELIERIDHKFDATNHRIRRAFMASQADIDAISTKLSQLGDTLKADDGAIQSEIARLQGQGVDVTGLQDAVDGLAADVDATTALVPSEPPVEPEPEAPAA